MKKTTHLIGLIGAIATMFVLLPYLPATFFATLVVVLGMIILTFWGHYIYNLFAPKRPLLADEELDSLDALCEEEEGEPVTDNELPPMAERTISRVPSSLAAEQKRKEQANKKHKNRKRAKLAKKSRREQNR